MVGWYHWLNGHESEKTPGDNEEQRRLVCCSPQEIVKDLVTEKQSF